jgi:hypothetical protein
MERLALSTVCLLAAAPTLGHAQECRVSPLPYFEFQVEVPAQWLPDSSVTPRPAPARGVEAQELPALVQFVVDSAGVPHPRTYKILKARDPELAEAGRTVVGTWRFRPARIGSCAVAQLVQTPLARE